MLFTYKLALALEEIWSRVIAKIMKIITGHKIKTSVQSCKSNDRKNVNYIAKPKHLTSTLFYKIPIQARYLPINVINKKGMRFFKCKRP